MGLVFEAVRKAIKRRLKKERIKKRIYANRDAVILDIADYIDAFCNVKRRHSHLGGVSPEEFEMARRRRALSTKSWELQLT